VLGSKEFTRLAIRKEGEALKSCTAFESQPLTYYCATGVFMEYEARPGAHDRNIGLTHYSYDTYTQFPAACYRYRAKTLLVKSRGDVTSVAEECLRPEAPLRRGCFYSLGYTHREPLSKQPERPATICGFGDAQDQAMCINGAIETLSEYNKEAAMSACRAFSGEKAAVCWEATRNEQYGLGKDFGLYYRQ
jgi:hypothetical protein